MREQVNRPSQVPVPPPNGSVVACADENVAVPAQRRLPDRRGALLVTEHRVPRVHRVLHVQVPHVRLSNLVAEGQHLLSRVHAEPHEPDLAVFVVKLVNGGRL